MMMLKVTIDNQSIDVEEGTTILQAARMIGGAVVPPAMCYYSKLKDSGGKCKTGGILPYSCRRWHGGSKHHLSGGS